MKNFFSSLAVFLLLFSCKQAVAQNPVTNANGFSVFVKNNLSLGNTNVSKAVAAGGNFKVGGTIGDVSAGTYTVGSTTAALVVGGSLDWSGSNTVIKNGYAKIGNCAGTTVWYTDPQNSNKPVQINQGPNYYSCCPYIQFNNHTAASFGGVSASNNPVCASTGINFNTDFTQLEANATGMAANQNSVTMYYNGSPITSPSSISGWGPYNQVNITLATGVNFLNLTGNDLNALLNLNITNAIDATHTLIINVDAPGSFTWNVQTLNGNVDPAYMLYNFSNTTTLNINNGQNIRGTLFAPKADVNKTLYNDIQGQVVAKSFTGVGNNIQGAYFNNSAVPGGGGTAASTVAAFTINNSTQCLAGNTFSFTNASTGSGTLTYKWDFGDNTTSTSTSPTKTYAAAGTYSVKLVTTGSGGKDSITKTVTVNAQPSTGFTINNASQNLSGNSFTFTSSNAIPGNSYAWKFRDNGATGSGANVTRTFSGVGVYDVTQIVTSSTGCKDSTTKRITVRTGSCSPTEPAWGFNVFVRNNANLIAPHTEGGVAAGGNLIIGGSYATSLNSIGTFRANGVPVSLLVGGKIDPSSASGTSFQVLTGTIAKIGDSTGYDVWYKDPNNAYSPIRIAPDGNYSGTPRIDFSSTANSFTPELSATENPIFQSNLIDFGAEFVKLKSYSTNLANYTNNVTLYTSSNLNTSYPGNSVSANGQVYVSLANGINVLNLTGTNLNNFQSLTFQGGAPSANKILLVNVDAPGTFNWDVKNSAGAGATDGQYVIYNFPNTTQLNIQGQSAVLGTVFAPFADIDKTVNQGNIDGQIIGQSYKHNGGEDHPQYFNSSLLNMCVQPVIASFTVNNQTQCLGGNSFQFTSNATGVAPLSYKWSFGDTTTSTTANPSHTYAAAGSYTVKLVITDNNGTKDSTTKTVIVNAAPIATFSVNVATQPLTGNSFAFTASSQISGNTYFWTLGDGTTSTSANITGKTYSAAGTYTVKLVVTSAQGCKDSTTQTVTVTPNPASASFTVNQQNQCLTGNNFQFASTSTGAAPLTYVWNFGDNTSSTTANPNHSYAAAGSYTVKLVVTDNNGSKDSSTKTVTVYPAATAGFTSNSSSQLLANNSFDFTTTAPVAGNTYFWDLGDGTTATTVNVTGKSYTATGTYTVKQVVTTVNGCKDSVTHTVTVTPNPAPAHAAFSVNNSSQCLAGNNFQFTSTSTGAAPLTYAWSFCDNTSATTANPNHSYAAAGSYTVKLVVTDNNGSKDSTTQTVIVNAQPNPAFTVNNTNQQLSGNSFDFAALNNAAGNSYFWDFGDGTTSAAPSVTGKGYTATGTYTVKLVITSAQGCKDSSTQTVTVTNNPPVAPTASFTVNDPTQCVKGNSFAFTSTSTGNNLTYNWDFGDGNSSAQETPMHTYASAGTYTVTLTVTNGGGSASTQQTVTVYPAATAGFAVSPAAAQYLTGNSFTFTSNNPQAGNSYAWDFGDGMTETSENTTHSYTAAGPYIVRQIVTNANDCKDTAYQTINVLSDSVSSGNNGGLESEGLGGLVTRRDYNRLKYSVNKAFDVMNAPLFDAPLYASKGAAAVQELSDMMPANLAAGDVPRISTPTDLTALTIAKEALSVDYTRKNVTKASVLGIQTQGRAYNHTKSICDRFKGGTIINIQQTNVRGFDFSRYAIRQANGIVEYAIAFAAGKKTGDAAYRLQTGWVISRYTKDDTVYNFQVWATAPADVDKLAGDILDKLSAVRPLSVVRSADNLPAAYITKGVRHKDTLLLTLRNTTGISNGQVSFEERTNELAGQQNRVLPVTYKANGDATVAVPIGDGYEYEGLLYLGDSLVDQVYLADGNWGLDYDQSLTSVKVYEPTNNPTRIYQDDELPVYRSVNLTAVSDDYITLYKALLPGTEPLDLTEYHTLKFHATGNGNVTIRLTRDSITSWPAQYKTTTMMVQEGKDYEIAFEDFVSDKLSAPFYPKDVKTLDFTMEAGGQKAQFDLKLENVAFSKKKSASLLALQSKKLSVAPNPIKGPFTVTYASDAARNLTLSVSDISGRVLYSQAVSPTVGTNTLTVDLKGDFPTGTVLFVSLRGSDDTKYETTKVSTQ